MGGGGGGGGMGAHARAMASPFLSEIDGAYDDRPTDLLEAEEEGALRAPPLRVRTRTEEGRTATSHAATAACSFSLEKKLVLFFCCSLFFFPKFGLPSSVESFAHFRIFYP